MTEPDDDGIIPLVEEDRVPTPPPAPAAPDEEGEIPLATPVIIPSAQATTAQSRPVAPASPPLPQATASDLHAVEQLHKAYKIMADQIGKVIVGQHEVVEQLLTALFCQGHILLVGVPGLAKTLLVKTVADLLHLSFKRVQFTPDLMPSDIIGTDVLEEDRTTGKRAFRFVKGPIFANMLLADEINRTPPKTQAALLEAMQEHRATAGENTYELPQPFFVLATQNPIEQEGTYPLPEAQLDRFMFMTVLRYPSADEELRIMKQATSHYKAEVARLLDAASILKLQHIVRRVPVAEHVYMYARDIVRATRPREETTPAYINDLVQWGAGPRASIALILASKARAVLQGRVHVTTEDIQKMAHPILRHRLAPTFSAQAAGMNADKIIDRLLADVAKPKT